MDKIKKNVESLKPVQNLSLIEKYQNTWKRMCSSEFLKPFLFLNLILNFGLEWAGFPALAFYMHTILKQMEIPFGRYCYNTQ